MILFVYSDTLYLYILLTMYYYAIYLVPTLDIKYKIKNIRYKIYE